MKQYFLNPAWDIIPKEDTIVFKQTRDQEIELSLRHYPLPAFNALLKGCGKNSLAAHFQSLQQIEEFLSRLLSTEIITVQNVTNKSKTANNYLDLLNKDICGSGKLISQNNPVALSRDNPFYQKFYVYHSIGFGPQFIPYQSSLSEGWGADKKQILAAIKSIVEGVERYSLADYNLATLPMKKWDEIKSQSLSPSQLGTTEKRFQEAGAIPWVKLENYFDKSPVYVPVDYAYHPVNYDELRRSPVCPFNISGIAGHQTKEAALISALLELCEHEALMVTWFGQRTTPTIDPTSIKQSDRTQLERLKGMGWKIILKDISLDLAPVVMAIALGPMNKQALIIGSCAAFTLKYAVTRALSEVTRTVLYNEATRPIFRPLDRADINDASTHEQYYASPKHLNHVSFLWQDSNLTQATNGLNKGRYKGVNLQAAAKVWQQSANPHKAELDYLVEEVFGPIGLTIYTQNMTPSEIEKQRLPLHVMRAVVPEMTRFVVGYGAKPIETERFRLLLKKYGQTKPYSRYPHPFS